MFWIQFLVSGTMYNFFLFIIISTRLDKAIIVWPSNSIDIVLLVKLFLSYEGGDMWGIIKQRVVSRGISASVSNFTFIINSPFFFMEIC